MLKRLYFAEVFVLANLGLIAVVAARRGLVAPSWRWIAGGVVAFGLYTLLGVAIRATVERVRRGTARAYLQHLRARDWLIDTVRIAFAGTLLTYTYCWIKISVPALHPRLFDQQLWDLDQTIFFGLAPTVFLLDLIGDGAALKVIDWSYAWVFAGSTFVAMAYFMSEPSRRIRVAFVNGNSLLWITGAWLYVLVPSLGPAYRFPDIWLAYDALDRTQYLQTILMRNHNNILRALRGQPHEPIHPILGIAAFPSLHVAFQTYVFFWMRRLRTSGEMLFGLFAATIFLGSMITGWHYLIDAIAGALMALACWWIFFRRARMARFLRLF